MADEVQDDNFIPTLSATECLTFYAAVLLSDNQQPCSAGPIENTESSSHALTIMADDTECGSRGPAAAAQAGTGQQSLHTCKLQGGVIQHVLQVVGLAQHGGIMVSCLPEQSFHCVGVHFTYWTCLEMRCSGCSPPLMYR